MDMLGITQISSFLMLPEAGIIAAHRAGFVAVAAAERSALAWDEVRSSMAH